MKPGSSRGMDTRRQHKSEQSKRRRNLRLTNRSTKPYPWPPKQAQPDVSKPGRSTEKPEVDTITVGIAPYVLHERNGRTGYTGINRAVVPLARSTDCAVGSVPFPRPALRAGKVIGNDFAPGVWMTGRVLATGPRLGTVFSRRNARVALRPIYDGIYFSSKGSHRRGAGVGAWWHRSIQG
jgi:hypothetical protein